VADKFPKPNNSKNLNLLETVNLNLISCLNKIRIIFIAENAKASNRLSVMTWNIPYLILKMQYYQDCRSAQFYVRSTNEFLT
jgi:hypothetical protein